MKKLYYLFFILYTSSLQAQRIGVSTTAIYNGELQLMHVVPSLTMQHLKSELELGVGFHPFINPHQTLLSGELIYKNYPNGNNEKFNFYFLGHLSFVSNKRNYYYPTRYNYFFLAGGYGFDIKVSKNIYLGTNFSYGVNTFQKKSTVPYESFSRIEFFEEFNTHLGCQFKLGYRF
ncbi:hypothetical protein [Crocinitomix algicola]|uniref:hypothetical protein n=1 Tax=Crocinitomix algicola TaxID=1740263 RepID=UPI0008730B49|nr:hypothetical protein [Crocinitomix algicola]